MMPRSYFSWFYYLSSIAAVATVLLNVTTVTTTDAFSITTTIPTTLTTRSTSKGRTTTTSLNGLFGGTSDKGFGKKKDPSSSSPPQSQQQPSSIDTTSTPLFTIPAKGVKIGALRFLIQMYLVGQQNEPTKDSWLTRQSESNPNKLETYYKDGTGMFALDFEPDGISVSRHGKRPSLQYALQESIMLHNVLDELDGIAFGHVDSEAGDEIIEEDKRLLQLSDLNAIVNARETLPARKE